MEELLSEAYSVGLEIKLLSIRQLICLTSDSLKGAVIDWLLRHIEYLFLDIPDYLVLAPVVVGGMHLRGVDPGHIEPFLAIVVEKLLLE